MRDYLSIALRIIIKEKRLCNAKIKQARQRAVLGEKHVPMAVGEPLERWGASAGWAQTRQRSVPLFLLYLYYEQG